VCAGVERALDPPVGVDGDADDGGDGGGVGVGGDCGGVGVEVGVLEGGVLVRNG
jgi:hypothetical protein